MSAAPRVNREPVVEGAAEKPDYPDNIVALFLRGMERVGEVQKQCFDIAVQQNAEMIDVWKKAAEKVPGAPHLPMFDLANGALNRYADTQKSAIDFMVDQSRIWTDAFNDRTSTVNKVAESTANVARQALEKSFGVQKKTLEHTAAHTKAVVEAARHQFGFTGTPADAMADTFQRGVDTIVEAQKELLNMVTH